MRYVDASNYATQRDFIESGNLITWRTDLFFHKLIRHWTGDSFAHCGIAIRLAGRVFVAEARARGGVQLNPLSQRAPFYVFNTGVDWQDANTDFALSQIGKHYSWLDAGLVALHLKSRNPEAWQCSEYAGWLLLHAGAEWCADYKRVTPSELALRASKAW